MEQMSQARCFAVDLELTVPSVPVQQLESFRLKTGDYASKTSSELSYRHGSRRTRALGSVKHHSRVQWRVELGTKGLMS